MTRTSSELYDSFHGMHKGSFDSCGLFIVLLDLGDAVDNVPHASKKLKLLVLLWIDILDIVRNFRKEKIC